MPSRLFLAVRGTLLPRQGNGFGTISPTVSNMYFNNPYCLAPQTRILCSDLIWRPVRDLAAGDEIIGFDEKSLPGQRRKMRIAKVLACPVIQQPSYRITLDDGREVVASSEHLWKEGSGGNWIYTRNLKPGRTIMDLGEPWETDDSWKGGWLAGVFDGEASLASRTEASPGGWYISFPQNPGPVLDLCERLLKEDGYHVRHKKDPGRDIHRLHVTGIYDCLRILGTCRPIRLLDKIPGWIDGISYARSRGKRRGQRYSATVKSVEFLGEQDVVAIATSTKTLFAEGLFSHNSNTYGPFLPRPSRQFTDGAFGPMSPIQPVPVDEAPFPAVSLTRDGGSTV